MSEYDKIAERASHTPLPWFVNHWDHQFVDSNAGPVANCNMAVLGKVQCEANTRLTAASPYLLAALEGMQQKNGCFDDCRWEYSGQHRAICLEATYAIAKARGSV